MKNSAMENENRKAKLTPEELEDLKQFLHTLDEKKLDNWKATIRTFEKYLKDGKLTDFETWILNSTPEDIRSLEMFLEKKPEPKFIKRGIHSIKQEFGKQGELSLFDDKFPLQYRKHFGIEIINEINKSGIDLNVTQKKLFQGILRLFTETKYKGNTDYKTIEEIMEEHPGIDTPDQLPRAYKLIKEIPVIRIGQRELLRLSGINENNRDSYQEGIKALAYLATQQYHMEWDHLVKEDGKPTKDSEGNYIKEIISTVDTLTKVKIGIDEKTKKLKYYEISLSPVSLDQADSYYVLIPYKWMTEVQKKVGKRRASIYIFRLLEFFCYQYEMIRRYNEYHKDKKPYTIKYSWEHIAKIIRMPESLYKKKRARALEILDESYRTAQDLGYLISYERAAAVDILELNPERYYNPKGITPAGS